MRNNFVSLFSWMLFLNTFEFQNSWKSLKRNFFVVPILVFTKYSAKISQFFHIRLRFAFFRCTNLVFRCEFFCFLCFVPLFMSFPNICCKFKRKPHFMPSINGLALKMSHDLNHCRGFMVCGLARLKFIALLNVEQQNPEPEKIHTWNEQNTMIRYAFADAVESIIVIFKIRNKGERTNELKSCICRLISRIY